MKRISYLQNYSVTWVDSSSKDLMNISSNKFATCQSKGYWISHINCATGYPPHETRLNYLEIIFDSDKQIKAKQLRTFVYVKAISFSAEENNQFDRIFEKCEFHQTFFIFAEKQNICRQIKAVRRTSAMQLNWPEIHWKSISQTWKFHQTTENINKI